MNAEIGHRRGAIGRCADSVGQEHVLKNVAIVVLTWNQRDVTLRCLESFRHVSYPLTNIVIWDNGSTDGTIDAIRARFPAVTLIPHATNLGVASGRNAAAAHALEKLRPSHLLFLDNDMTVSSGFVERLYEPFEYDPRLGQTEARILMANDPTRINAAGGSTVDFVRGIIRPVGYGEHDGDRVRQPRSCLPNGGATMVRADVFRELCGFDSIFDPYGPEDLDFSFRVRKAGYNALYVPEAVVYHDHARTVEDGEFSESYASNKVRNLLILMRRHASLGQKLGFIFWGAPTGFVRVIFREVRNGNFGIFKGFLSGLRRTMRSE